jgi:hypothetical protein
MECLALNGVRIMGKIWVKAVIVYIKAPFKHLLRVTEEIQVPIVSVEIEDSNMDHGDISFLMQRE